MGKDPFAPRSSKSSGGSPSGISIKPSHVGLLHQDLGVPQGEPIPAESIETAEHSQDPTVRKRAVFAANAEKWKH